MKEIQEKKEKKGMESIVCLHLEALGGKGKKGDDMDSLTKAIQARGKVRFDSLFAKYHKYYVFVAPSIVLLFLAVQRYYHKHRCLIT